MEATESKLNILKKEANNVCKLMCLWLTSLPPAASLLAFVAVTLCDAQNQTPRPWFTQSSLSTSWNRERQADRVGFIKIWTVLITLIQSQDAPCQLLAYNLPEPQHCSFLIHFPETTTRKGKLCHTFNFTTDRLYSWTYYFMFQYPP